MYPGATNQNPAFIFPVRFEPTQVFDQLGKPKKCIHVFKECGFMSMKLTEKSFSAQLKFSKEKVLVVVKHSKRLSCPFLIQFPSISSCLGICGISFQGFSCFALYTSLSLLLSLLFDAFPFRFSLSTRLSPHFLSPSPPSFSSFFYPFLSPSPFLPSIFLSHTPDR